MTLADELEGFLRLAAENFRRVGTVVLRLRPPSVDLLAIWVIRFDVGSD